MSKVQVCSLCGNEKVRTQKQGRAFRYFCNCVEWKAQLKLLEAARVKRKAR